MRGPCDGQGVRGRLGVSKAQLEGEGWAEACCHQGKVWKVRWRWGAGGQGSALCLIFLVEPLGWGWGCPKELRFSIFL